MKASNASSQSSCPHVPINQLLTWLWPMVQRTTNLRMIKTGPSTRMKRIQSRPEERIWLQTKYSNTGISLIDKSPPSRIFYKAAHSFRRNLQRRMIPRIRTCNQRKMAARMVGKQRIRRTIMEHGIAEHQKKHGTVSKGRKITLI